MELGLKGKKAIITGATRGIGRAIAETLAGEKVDIGLCARDGDQVKDAVAAKPSVVWISS
jgi:3-oxoacyl-[acyl-carrier protein] reductase